MRLVVAALVALSVTSMADDLYYSPAGEYTGYFWTSLNRDEKLMYLVGFSAGYAAAKPSNSQAQKNFLNSCWGTPPDKSKAGECLKKSLDVKSEAYQKWESEDLVPPGKYSDTITSTDRFFADLENRVMPVAAAWIVIKLKQRGEPQAQVDATLDLYREHYIRSVRESCEKYGPMLLVKEAHCKAVGATLPNPKP